MRMIHWISALSDRFQMPLNQIAGVPVIEINGNSECRIESHEGLASFDEECVGINSKLGEILVTGKQLGIKLMSKTEITVTGVIFQVSLKTFYDK